MDDAREPDGVLLAPDEPPPFMQQPGSAREWFLVCDHAANRVPRALGSLGLTRAQLETHIAWDIGALEVARHLAMRLDAPLFATRYSRLVVDCNRYPAAADAMPAVSDHLRIPGNRALTEEGRRQRVRALFAPYHRAIDAALCEADRRGETPLFLSIHSCTDVMNGQRRPWEIGVGWRRDDRAAAPVIESLRARGDVIVGDNQPYGVDIGDDFTTPEHAMTRGLPHLQVEFRQDLLSTVEDARRWADVLHEALTRVGPHELWSRRAHCLAPADDIRGIGRWTRGME
ncbi:MAG TPA: N-formylglutamate amidohydrolase [Steroidobacteraceae bacterium]|nr:N-formylglutamate amidohydrolase [Steroidobacteraceae bacterium]